MPAHGKAMARITDCSSPALKQPASRGYVNLVQPDVTGYKKKQKTGQTKTLFLLSPVFCFCCPLVFCFCLSPVACFVCPLLFVSFVPYFFVCLHVGTQGQTWQSVYGTFLLDLFALNRPWSCFSTVQAPGHFRTPYKWGRSI